MTVRSLLHYEVRHSSREGAPTLSGEAVLDLVDGDAELDELLLGQVKVRPLAPVPVHASVQEAHAASAADFELVGEFREHVVDLLAVLLDSAGVEADRANDTFGSDIP